MPVKTINNPDEFRANIAAKLSSFFINKGGSDKHAANLEKGIHNWALKEATNRKVVKKWDNPFFVQIYLDHLVNSNYLIRGQHDLRDKTFFENVF